jgi:uncharacterized membrane protein YccF (DUF307 family)
LIVTSFNQATDVIGVTLAIAMVVMFAAVDLLPVGHPVRRVSGFAAGSAFTALMVLVGYRFAVMAA